MHQVKMTQLAVESGWFHCGTARRTCSVGPGVKKATIVGWSACSARPLSTLPAIQPVSAVVQQKASSATSVCHFGPIQLKMSAAATFEDDMGGMDVDQLPPELREQAKNEKKSQGGYRYDSPADKQHIKQQRAAIWAWFRGLGGNLIKHGVNLTKVPLPVELCEPRSFLQRLTDSWSYIDLLHAAAACSDPVERLKLVVAFAVGGFRQQVSCDKPFNPILGETLQAAFPCGCAVYAEQVSHHPPVSCWQVTDHQGRFEFTGSSCWSATFTGNSVKGTQEGTSRLRFARDGATVTWSLPTIHIRGVLFGDRVVKYHDTIIFEDVQNHLRCELSIDPNAPKRGILKRVINKARHPRSKHAHDQLVGDLVSAEGREQLFDSCAGSWLTHLWWDKGVRSIVLPDLTTNSTAAAAAAAACGSNQASKPGDDHDNDHDDDNAVVCHSIGSFSTTSGSVISQENAAGTAAVVTARNGKQHGSSFESEDSSAIFSDSCASLTADALAAHAATAAAVNGADLVDHAPASAAVGHPANSSGVLGGSDAAGHRSGRGVSVVKKLWDVDTCQVIHVRPLSDDDARLLPSDCRHRPDVSALAGGCTRSAQHWKLLLEERQRRDRALRGGDHLGASAQHHNTDNIVGLDNQADVGKED